MDRPMRSNKSESQSETCKSETWLLLPLLPIFVIGAPPMLLFVFLGFVGVILFGILLISVGLSIGLNANSDFSEQVIVHGYANKSERAIQATDLHSAVRFALVIDAIGVGLVIAGLCGFFYFGR
jgi:hypothetical protein